jgi:hypothetical protein
MRKILTLLAVTMLMVSANGCCCRRLCPFLDRGASCCCLFPQPTYAPVAAAPCPPPCPPATYAPAAVAPQQYVVPTATTVAPQAVVAAPVAQPCCPQPCAPPCPPPQPCCTKWDPCQCAVVAQPQPSYAAQPICCPAPQPMFYAEPSCGYVESSCGEPYAGSVGYGPSFGGCSGCGPMGCESGCCGGSEMSGEIIDGGMITGPTPEAITTETVPGPAAE